MFIFKQQKQKNDLLEPVSLLSSYSIYYIAVRQHPDDLTATTKTSLISKIIQDDALFGHHDPFHFRPTYTHYHHHHLSV